MQRVLPDLRFQPLEGHEAIFDSFFHIKDPYSLVPPYERELAPVYMGLFEDNDPRRRLMAVENYNTDISQYWEWSGRGFRPFDDTNEAYKLGINYLIYGLTH